MLVLRCTAKLLKEVGIRAANLHASGNAEPTPPLGSWFANLLRLDRRKCVLFTSAETLYTFLVPAVQKADLEQIGDLFIQRLLGNLAREGLADAWKERCAGDASQVILARTNSRSVLGSMNDLAYQCEVAVKLAGGLARLDVTGLNRRLNRIPMGAIDYRYAIGQFREELDLSL